MEPMKIYLAGDMHSNWREEIIKHCNITFSDDDIKKIVWINPKRIIGRKHDHNVAHDCVTSDLDLIDGCNVFIANFSRRELYATMVETVHAFENDCLKFILLNKFEPYKEDVGAEVIGSNYFEFPYQTPYWFFIQYFNTTAQFSKDKIYYSDDIFTSIEDILEKIFHRKLKRNKESEDDLEDFLKDLVTTDNGYEKTKIISKFKRDYSISKEIKNKHKKCQICDFTFKKKNGEFYNEMHHIIPLSKNGKDEKINTLVLCANCHRQLHYADVDISKIMKDIVIINGVEKKIMR